MDGVLETTESFIVERGRSVDFETRQDLEVALTDEMKDLRVEFGDTMKKIIAEVPGPQKDLDMVKVQVKLARILWCFGQLSTPPDGVEESDSSYQEMINHRAEMEQAVRNIIFNPQNPESWVNVRGSKNSDLCSKELYGVVSTLAFLNLMQEIDPDYASGAMPSQLFSSPQQDVFDKVDMVIKKNGRASLFQLKSGDEIKIDVIPFEENGTFSSSPLVNSNEMNQMRKLGGRILRDDKGVSLINIAAVRVPSLVNGQVRSVDVFGNIIDRSLVTEFKKEAKDAGII